MDYQRQSHGWMTFLEHYWVYLLLLSAFTTSRLLTFFSQLSGVHWMWFYAIALFIAVAGVAQIFYSKLPLYRQRRFFTFGSGLLPEDRRPFYRQGYRYALFAIALLLCLSLSSL